MMDLKRKLAVAAVGVVGFAGLGAGVAAAQTSPSAPKAPVTAPAPADTDNVQSGDQTTPDVPGATEKPEASAAAEKAGTEKAGTESAGPEEPGDASLPGGGHADPAGANVDHQFEGAE